LLCVAVAASGQQFRSEIVLSVLDVTVTDEDGRVIEGLTSKDFDVRVDGQPVKVVSAAFVTVDTESPSPTGGEGILASDAFEGRLFSIVVDDLSISSERIGRARDAVNRILSLIPQSDLVSLVFSGGGGVHQFTRDRSRLHDSLQRFTGRRPDPDEADATIETRHNMGRVLDTLTSVVEALRRSGNRRSAVLFVTEGLDRGVADQILSRRGLGRDVQALMNAAADAHALVYPIDIRGLAAADDSDRDTLALSVLADSTGAVPGINSNDLQQAARTAVQDLSAYYVIGFAGSEVASKTPSRVEVRVVTRPARVRARRSVVGPHATPSGPPGWLPGGSIHMRVQVAPSADKQRDHVYMWAIFNIDGNTLHFRGSDGSRRHCRLKVDVIAVDSTGRVAAQSAEMVTLNVDEQRRLQVVKSGTRLITGVRLKPGSYQIRAIVTDADTSDYGLAVGEVDVPDYRRAPLAASGLFVASRQTRTVPTVRDQVERFRGRLGSPPTAVRTFEPGDELELYSEVYPNQQQTLSATLTVFDSHNAVVTEANLETAATRDCLSGTPCTSIRNTTPLRLTRPGTYRLHVAVLQGLQRTGTETVVEIR
jgi:VWFA-related protein